MVTLYAVGWADRQGLCKSLISIIDVHNGPKPESTPVFLGLCSIVPRIFKLKLAESDNGPQRCGVEGSQREELGGQRWRSVKVASSLFLALMGKVLIILL